MGVKKRVNNSIGINRAERYYRKTCGKFDEKTFRIVINTINKYLQQSLASGNDIKFPCGMGVLQLSKFKTRVDFVDGKIKTNLAIDWPSTKKLWEEDAWCRKHGRLVRYENEFIYRIYYRKQTADYKNKTYMKFYTNRTLQRTLSKNIKEGKVDAFLINS